MGDFQQPSLMVMLPPSDVQVLVK